MLPPAGSNHPRNAKWHLLLLISTLSLLSFLWIGPRQSSRFFQQGTNPTPPLAMEGGDPHLRALMRTISASESHDPSPYTLLYGGEHIQDLRNHPDRCITILAGPNQGNCTTAAGRYQFITTTWEERAQQYHPHPSGLWLWQDYSFEPQYQDQVVYAWLQDSQAWGADIPTLLEQGQLDLVLRLLSDTWTSLGYGIEDNAMTSYLPRIYQQMLAEELARAQAAEPPASGQEAIQS
jgi:muramidase (phage lysozyme)